MDGNGLRALILVALVGWTIAANAASIDEEATSTPPERDLVKAANAPISDVFQLRIQDSYVPEFEGLRGTGNTVTIGVTMPLPKNRLLPFPQLSLLTIPAAITVPGGSTGFGELRFLDIAVLDPGHDVLVGIGAGLVFPSATEATTGQGKWQAGPAAVVAYVPKSWLLGVLVQNPISFAGDRDRADVNAMLLQPFATYQLGNGWFVRSQPLMIQLGERQAAHSARSGRGTGVRDRRAARELLHRAILERRARRTRADVRHHGRRRVPVPQLLGRVSNPTAPLIPRLEESKAALHKSHPCGTSDGSWRSRCRRP